MKFCIIVEDIPSDAYLLEYHLGKLDFLTSTTNNEFKAIKMVREGCVDIISIGIHKPDIGLKTINHIRSINEDIPIIAVSTHIEYMYKAIEHGATEFLLKPHTGEDIYNLFKKYTK